jgi:DNA-binding IclR family transcriptional regulator
MAWVPGDEVEEWLRRLNLPDDSEEVRYYRDALEVTREQGYVVSLDGTISELAIRLAVRLARATTQHERLDMAVKLADLLRNEEYAHLGQANGIIHRQDVIAAPVFGPDDRVALTLSVIGRPGDIAEKNVPTIVRALTAATRRITASIGGRTPARPPRDDLPRRPDAA